MLEEAYNFIKTIDKSQSPELYQKYEMLLKEH